MQCATLVDQYYLTLEWCPGILEVRVVSHSGGLHIMIISSWQTLSAPLCGRASNGAMDIPSPHVGAPKSSPYYMQSKFNWRRWLRSTARTLQDVRKRSCRAVGSPHHQLSHTPPPSSRTDKPQHGNRGEKKGCEARSDRFGRHQMDVIASVQTGDTLYRQTVDNRPGQPLTTTCGQLLQSVKHT